MIDADYTGEVKIILVNLGDQDYEVQKGDKIAQLIIEKIMNEEIVLVKELDITERGTKGFGSSDTEMNKQVSTSANLLTKTPHQKLATPSQPTMTKQVRTGVDLLTNQFQKVTMPTDHRR